MTLDHAIERIQFCYPQVYYACHTRHSRARSEVRRNSVLEVRRLHAVLAKLSRSNLVAIIGGLETLARACRQAVRTKRME